MISEQELLEKSLEELQTELKNYGLSEEGSKEELVSRIIKYYEDQKDVQINQSITETEEKSNQESINLPKNQTNVNSPSDVIKELNATDLSKNQDKINHSLHSNQESSNLDQNQSESIEKDPEDQKEEQSPKTQEIQTQRSNEENSNLNSDTPLKKVDNNSIGPSSDVSMDANAFHSYYGFYPSSKMGLKSSSNTKGQIYKIFVGGLHPEVTDTDLNTYFSQFGPISHINIVYDKYTGRSKNYGFVEFENEEAFQAALDYKDPVIRGKRVDVKKQQGQEKEDSIKCKVYLGNLPQEITETQIKDILSPFGSIEDINIIKDSKTNKCYAFVRFSNSSIAHKVLELKTLSIGNHTIKIAQANIKSNNSHKNHNPPHSMYYSIPSSSPSSSSSPSPYYNQYMYNSIPQIPTISYSTPYMNSPLGYTDPNISYRSPRIQISPHSNTNSYIMYSMYPLQPNPIGPTRTHYSQPYNPY